jgi:hypothetical protein
MRGEQHERSAALLPVRVIPMSRVMTYRINDSPDAAGGKSITCLRCGMTSHNPHDVEHRYCGNCDMFHDTGLSRTGELHASVPKRKWFDVIDNWPYDHPGIFGIVLTLGAFTAAAIFPPHGVHPLTWSWKDAAILVVLFPINVGIIWFCFGPLHRWMVKGVHQLFDRLFGKEEQ